MSDKAQEPEKAEPKQKTLRGYEIPLPSRSEIMDALKKVAKPQEVAPGRGFVWETRPARASAPPGTEPGRFPSGGH